MAIVRIMNTLLRTSRSARTSSPSCPTSPHLRHGRHVPPVRHLEPARPEVRAPKTMTSSCSTRKAKTGQVLQEGINEAGAMSDWIAAGTAYSGAWRADGPFYIFYSMFGLQRTMDLCWAAADQRTRGFLIGGTAGRTTLNGEGLQHEDGHSQLMANMIPNCISYDPTFQYEVAVVVQDGMRRMFAEQEDVYYYLTVMNENYEHPDAGGCRGRHHQGDVRLRKGGEGALRVQLLGSGTIFNEVIAAAELLKNDWGVEADIWGCPSFNELARDGQDAARWNLLHPLEAPRQSHVEQKLDGAVGPVIAATDYIRCSPSRSARRVKAPTSPWAPTASAAPTPARSCATSSRSTATGSPWRPQGLADEGKIERDKVAAALVKYNSSTRTKPNPMSV